MNLRLKKLQEKVKEHQEKVGEKVCLSHFTIYCCAVIAGCNERMSMDLIGLLIIIY